MNKSESSNSSSETSPMSEEAQEEGRQSTKRPRLIPEKELDEPAASPRTEENLRIFAFSKIGEQTPVLKTDKKYFVCIFCKYKTAHYSNLYVHMRTHTGEKPYYCGACGHRASQGSTLKTHIKSRHDGNIEGCYNLDCDLRVKLKHVIERETEIVIAPIINDEIVMTESQLNTLRMGISEADTSEPTTSVAQTEGPTQSGPQSAQPTPSVLPQNIPFDPLLPYLMYYQQMLQTMQRMPYLQNFGPMERPFIMRPPQVFPQHMFRDFSSPFQGAQLPENIFHPVEDPSQHSCPYSDRLNSLRPFMRSLANRLMSLSREDPNFDSIIEEIIKDINNRMQ